MKTKQEIEHFIGFCKIIEQTYPIRILELFSHNKNKLQSFRTKLETSLKANKTCLLDDFNLLIGDQIEVALNILNWLEE